MTFALDEPTEEDKCSEVNGAQNTTELHYNYKADVQFPATYTNDDNEDDDDNYDDDDDDDDYDDLFEGSARSVVSQRRKNTSVPKNVHTL